MAETPPVIVIGAGLAGLAAAHTLAKAGVRSLVLESSDSVGGRVRTDSVDGFLLDRGFQVLQTAYPEYQALNLGTLDLCPFYPGAVVWWDGRFHRVSDPFRRPWDALVSVVSPIGSWADKARVACVRHRALSGSMDQLWERPECSTNEFLKRHGFSDVMVDRFFRPFLGGIFLESGLRTSSRQFEFVFRMMAQGATVVPKAGMGAIPRHLVKQIPDGWMELRLGRAVVELQRGFDGGVTGVQLADGTVCKSNQVVLAVEAPSAARLLKLPMTPRSRSVCTWYFTAPARPHPDPVLHLNGSGTGPVNHAVWMNEVSPGYAPPGQGLLSATVLGDGKIPEADIRMQMSQWFGTEPTYWRHLRTYSISHAQPEPGELERSIPGGFRGGCPGCALPEMPGEKSPLMVPSSRVERQPSRFWSPASREVSPIGSLMLPEGNRSWRGGPDLLPCLHVREATRTDSTGDAGTV